MEKKCRFFDPDIGRKSRLLDIYQQGKAAANIPPLFSIIEFDISGLCNRKCIFCPRNDPKIFPNTNKYMPVELYEKIMKDLKRVDFDGIIHYSAFSEPLLHENIGKLIALSKHYCPGARVEVITNGDLLTSERLLDLFAAGLDAICISMYDGPHQKEHFNNLKRQTGLGDNRVVLRARWLSPEGHYGITLTNRAGTLENKDIGINAVEKPAKRACHHPFYQTFVDYEGRVLLCTHDWGRKLIVGNVNSDSILEIWNNDILKKVRINLAKENRNFPPCNLCDAEGLLMGVNHFNEWVKYYREQRLIEE